MGVLNGQAVDATITNAAFLEKNQDSTGIGEVTLASTTPGAGAQVDSLQREHNSAASFMGKALNSLVTDLPAWVNNDVGTATDPLFDRADALTERFNDTTGHNHDGTAGNGGPISSSDIINTPLRGYVRQGVDILGVTGSNSTVTLDFSGFTPGGSTSAVGVVTDPPWNKVVIRQATGADQDDVFKDSSGNVVYGRLTFALGVWALSYYVNLSGTETAYSFAVSSDVRYYYQEIFNPLDASASPPVFSEFAVIPSDNQTVDVITATTSLQGKVSLSSSAPGAIASSGSAGTANAIVANANHTHEGVHSVKASGYSQLLGDVEIAGSGGATVTQATSIITVDAPALSSTAPADVGSASSIGIGTTSARADHVHQGVHSLAKSGSSALYADVTLTGSAGVTLTQTLQNIDISAPALASTAPADVASSAVTGVGTTSARADHVHRGVFSVSKNGSVQLFGSVTLSGGTNVTLTQTGQDISIAASGGGGGGGSLLFYDTPSPEILTEAVARSLNAGAKYAFDSCAATADNQAVFVDFKIPNSYTSGNIVIRLSGYTPATSAGVGLSLTAFLVRAATDSYAAPTLSNTTTASTLAPGTANRLFTLTATLSTGGVFGAGNATAGDIIRVGIRTNYPVHTITDVLYLVTSASEVTFS